MFVSVLFFFHLHIILFQFHNQRNLISKHFTFRLNSKIFLLANETESREAENENNLLPVRIELTIITFISRHCLIARGAFAADYTISSSYVVLAISHLFYNL